MTDAGSGTDRPPSGLASTETEPKPIAAPPGVSAETDPPLDPPPDDAPRWVSFVTAAAIVGFSLMWVLVVFIVDLGIYGTPDNVLAVHLYRDYAEQVLGGLVPYRDFAFEYPPLALVPIVGPALIAGSPLTVRGYREAFALFEAGIGMVTMIFVMRTAAALGLGRRELLAAAAMVAASPVLLGPLMLARYDLWPALFAAAAIWCVVMGRHGLAGVAIGFGVLAKVYPVVLLPVVALYLWRNGDRRNLIRLVTAFVLVVGIGVLPFLVLAPEGIVSAFVRAFQRPIQVESLGAVLLFVLNAVGDEPIRVIHTFDSFNLAGSLPEAVATAQTALLAGVTLAILVLFARGRASLDRMTLAAAAALCAYVAFGKVFSPQYLMWLIAPLAVVRARGWSPHIVALVVAILLTGIYYPRFYYAFYGLREIEWIALILGRNLILVGLTAYFLARLARPSETGPPEGSPLILRV